MAPHLTVEQRQLALRLRARGWSLREIGRQVGCSHVAVRVVTGQGPRRPGRRAGRGPGPGRLSLADREEISIGLRAGESFTAIAAGLGRAVSTVSREVAGGSGRGEYRAWGAPQRAGGRGTAAAGSTGRGGRISALVPGRGVLRRASWPARGWPRRSAGGWRCGGRRCRS